MCILVTVNIKLHPEFNLLIYFLFLIFIHISYHCLCHYINFTVVILIP